MAETPVSRDERIRTRSTKDIERVRLQRLTLHNLDAALNTGNHPLAGFTKLHDSRRVDESGAPALREVIIRWLDGEPSERSKLVQSLQKLNASKHKKLYRVVNALLSPVEQGDGTPSYRVLAAQLSMSKSSVGRSIVALRSWLETEGIA